MTRHIFSICFIFISISNASGQTLTVSNAQLNFGVVFENAPVSLPITITNNMGKTVAVTGIRFYNIYGQPAFSTTSGYFTIANGSSQTIYIEFAPRHNIYHNSEMIIENDGQRGFVSVDLVGQGRYSKTYYATSENNEEESLKTSLKNITGNNYNSLGYNFARDSMFMAIDNKKVNGQGATQNTLECIYTGRLAVGYLNRTDCQTNDQFNTEHTFPQGFFNSLEPMKSDLHHLYPTDDGANNVRASYPFGIVNNASWSMGGSKFDNNANIFEPRDIQKGASARSMLYFVIRYQNYSSFLNSQEGILKTWNKNYLPSTIEQKRNDDIYILQNNRNPFVDYPQFADRITSFSNTSVAPTIYSFDKSQNDINYQLLIYATSNLYRYVLVNNGNQTIQFTNFNLSNNSILNFANGTGSNTALNPGEAIGLDIDLHPSFTGTVTENLSFQTNVPGMLNVSVPISGLSSAVGMWESSSTSAVYFYPNPASDKLFINGLQSNVINVTNLLGENVYAPLQQNTCEYILDVSQLPAGVYFITSKDNNNNLWRQSFVKK